jgi:cytochrome c
MRKVLLLMAFSPLFFACGSSDDKATPAEEKKTEEPKPVVDQAELDKGLEMIGSLDCITCHKISETSLGPAYTDVAKKYEPTEANIDTLISKVIHGGSGVWGPTPMTPHPTLSVDSVRTMVKYILSLRNQQ